METSLLTGASAVGGEGLRLPADFLACRGPPVGCGLLLTRGHQSGLRGSPPGECEKSRRARETELELHSCTSSPPALEECFGVCLTMAVCIYHEKQTRIGTRAPWDVWRPWILGDKLLPCPLAPPKSEGTRVTGGRDTPGGGVGPGRVVAQVEVTSPTLLEGPGPSPGFPPWSSPSQSHLPFILASFISCRKYLIICSYCICLTYCLFPPWTVSSPRSGTGRLRLRALPSI